MRPFSEILSAKPGVSLVKTAKYTEGSDTRNPYLAVLQGWIFPGFMPLPGIFSLAFLPHAYLRATKGGFFPVDIYYNTSCGILQAKSGIFFQFYFNQKILCSFNYVNQCIFDWKGYVSRTKSSAHKYATQQNLWFPAVKISPFACGLRPRYRRCTR